MANFGRSLTLLFILAKLRMLVNSVYQFMNRLPQRVSLVSQVTGILRERIVAGEWRESLPGERELCVRLGVSRPTLRAALEALRREGRLEVAQGKRSRISASGERLNEGTRTTVGLLTPVPMHRMAPFVMLWVDELRKRLTDEGFNLEILVTPASERSRPEQILERTVGEKRAAVWILLLSSEAMQKWFFARGLPCVIAGSCFPGVQVPSVDIDCLASCRHAAGLFIAKGHRRIALLLPEARTAGDLASECGFMQGATRGVAVQARIVRHDETVTGVCKQLDELTSGSAPVTAILIARSVHALIAMTYFQQRGRRIPQDVALISRDNDTFLNYVCPALTRYTCDAGAFASRVSRFALQIAKEGIAPPRQVLLMPELLKGGSI